MPWFFALGNGTDIGMKTKFAMTPTRVPEMDQILEGARGLAMSSGKVHAMDQIYDGSPAKALPMGWMYKSEMVFAMAYASILERIRFWKSVRALVMFPMLVPGMDQRVFASVLVMLLQIGWM